MDVLSFSTAVSVAAERRIAVYPHPWHDSAAELADTVDAVLAVGRRQVSAERPWSLSPAALRRAPYTPRLVLPSPNGSAIAAEAARGCRVVAGCLRNSNAVAQWIAANGYGTADRPVLLIAAGERWPDGSLRPAVEDRLGAGAILAALANLGAGPLSPEATVAAGGFREVGDAAAAIAGCASALELAEGGFGADVAIAAEIDSTDMVPVLSHGAFIPAHRWGQA